LGRGLEQRAAHHLFLRLSTRREKGGQIVLLMKKLKITETLTFD